MGKLSTTLFSLILLAIAGSGHVAAQIIEGHADFVAQSDENLEKIRRRSSTNPDHCNQIYRQAVEG